MHVALFRARNDGERTAERLRALGHEAVLAPVLDVVPTGAPLPSGPFAAVIFTSAHGVQCLGRNDAAGLLGLPCFCVGSRTAECASAAGFRDLRLGRADAEELAALVQATLASPGRLLLVAGRDRKPVIETRLSASGYEVSVVELYAAKAIERWPAAAEAAFAQGRVHAALHYSRRSASLAVSCAQHGSVLDGFRRARHHCMSEDAAAPLRKVGFSDILVAAEPSEACLLRTLGPAAAEAFAARPAAPSTR